MGPSRGSIDVPSSLLGFVKSTDIEEKEIHQILATKIRTIFKTIILLLRIL
jgi:hypothetical protein